MDLIFASDGERNSPQQKGGLHKSQVFIFWMEAVEWEWYAGKRMTQRQREWERDRQMGAQSCLPFSPSTLLLLMLGREHHTVSHQGGLSAATCEQSMHTQSDTAGRRPVLSGPSTAAAAAAAPFSRTLCSHIELICSKALPAGRLLWRWITETERRKHNRRLTIRDY